MVRLRREEEKEKEEEEDESNTIAGEKEMIVTLLNSPELMSPSLSFWLTSLKKNKIEITIR